MSASTSCVIEPVAPTIVPRGTKGRRHSVATLLLSLPVAATAWTQAAAQENEPPVVEDEVTVTAQRVEQQLRNVPMSVARFAGEELQERAVFDVQGLSESTPGLVISGQSSSTGDVALYLRGIGSNTFGLGTESTVGFYLDGVYIPRPQAFFNQFLDLDRVEVLRGPQGTLWGRNSTGGAINLVSEAPTGEFGGRLSAQYGELESPADADERRFQFTLNGALSDRVFARLTLASAQAGDFTENTALAGDADNLDGWSGRASLQISPAPSWSVLLRLDRTDDDAHYNFHFNPGAVAARSNLGSVVDFFDLDLPAEPFRVAANIAPRSDYEEDGLSLHLIKTLGSGGTNLTSITSFRQYDSTRFSDIDGTPLDFIENVGFLEGEWWSQEVQLAGGNDRIDWIAGLYAFHEEGFSNVDTITDLALFEVAFFANNPGLFLFNPADYCSLGFFAPTNVCGPSYYGAIAPFLGLSPVGNKASGNFFIADLETDSLAGYGQVSWRLNDRWRVTGGLRYTEDDKRQQLTTIDFITFQPTTVVESDSWDALSPKLGVEFRPRPDWLLYGSLATGFKSGGFNSTSAQAPFDEENITSFEVGTRTRLAGDKVFLDAALFHYDYEDLQVAVLFPDRSSIENAAEATVNGLDLNVVVRPSSRFRIDLGLEWLDDEFDSFTSQDPVAVAAVQDDLNAMGIFDPVTLALAGALVPPSDLSGRSLPRAPDLSSNLALEYVFAIGEGSLLARAEHQYVDDISFDPFGRLTQDAYDLLHANITWRPSASRWSVSLYGRNLGNEEYLTNELFVRVAGSLQVWAPPRQVGLQLGFEF